MPPAQPTLAKYIQGDPALTINHETQCICSSNFDVSECDNDAGAPASGVYGAPSPAGVTARVDFGGDHVRLTAHLLETGSNADSQGDCSRNTVGDFLQVNVLRDGSADVFDARRYCTGYYAPRGLAQLQDVVVNEIG